MTSVVVDDRFTSYDRLPGAVTYGTFLSSHPSDDVTLGLGVPHEAYSGTDPQAPHLATQAQTHKRLEKNVMVTNPTQVGASTYEAELRIDPGNDLLADHLTGLHIPGMAVLEAARQMWTAVTETYLRGEGRPDVRFVIREVRQQFHHYVFPLPTTVRYTLVSSDVEPVATTYTARIEFIQNEQITSTVTGTYSVIDQAICAKQETMAVRVALRLTNDA
jgi:hypothetical protein